MSSHERDEKREPPRGLPTFSRYEVRDVLGEGATSVVYSAWDRELHRPVAIKLLRETAGLSDLTRQRFRREAQAAAGMAHPNVLTLYDAGGGLKLNPVYPDLLFCRALAAEKLAGQDAAAALPALELVRQDLEKALEAGSPRWTYRPEAEAALVRIRERRGEPVKK